jgi:radical SAM superfamily enzyme YgiQ (UPF0313 family)
MQFNRPDILRPPSERNSYFLPLTSGCSNNACIFCNYYDSTLQIRECEEVKNEIDALALYMKRGIRLTTIPTIVYAIAEQWDGRRIFLQDGDALVYPFPKLKETLQYINDKLSGVERIAAYATAQDILRLRVGELKDLCKLKLGILYMGVESGDDGVLNRMCKGANHSEMVEAARKVKEAGIALSVTVILGLGGKEESEKHALATAKILSEIDPDYAGALTLTLIPNTPLYQQWEQYKFSLISPFESLKELLMIIENSSFSNCFFSSMHASNYFSIRGILPQDKSKVVKELKYVLKQENPLMLRPEILRGL